ncbi:unnamed protein product [Ambrosiozyma monospora]|uniref:Unnamed protein product n=1 Tax=Ambrosiozyma monospora TaxID=43982 RepID=A0ACB5T8V9_AMBMO|nr:unnamed protein product [Ambrosiozyma monospora]
MTKSALSVEPARHAMLNLDSYATVTSPLRRFTDMVNHWQLHSFKSQGKPMFSKSNVAYMVAQLTAKNEILSRIQRKTDGFYTFKALKQLQEEQKNDGSKTVARFKCIVNRNPTDDGEVSVILLDYGVRGVLRTSWYALGKGITDQKIDGEGKMKQKKLLSDIEVGDIIENVIIEDVDLLDGSIVLTSESV